MRGNLVGPAALACALALSAPADDDLAHRTLDNADQLMKEGKVEQALRDFEQVFTAYPDSGLADDALYRIGSYYYPVDTVDTLGTIPEGSILKARDLFQKIKMKYPGEDNAPAALLKLGWIALDPSNPQRSLDEAYAAFSGVVNIYPASSQVDRALFGAGYADFLAARYDKSVGSFARVAEEFPHGSVADDAHYHMGLAWMYQGVWIRALEEFQAVRNQYPSSSLASRCLDRITQIYTLKVRPGVSGKPPFTHDASYAAALPADAARGDTALAIDGSSGLHLLDSRTGALYRLDHEGKPLSTGSPMTAGVSLWADPAGVEIIAAGSKVRSGAEIISPARQEGTAQRPLTRIVSAVRVGFKELALLDEERNEVLIYAGDPAKLKLRYRDSTGRARLAGLAVGAAGKLYTIDRRSRRILEISPDGTSKEVPTPSGADSELQEPVGVAADDIGDLFVLDKRAAAVVVMTVDGKVIQKIPSQAGTAAEFSSPTALAVGPRAEIYVHDARRKTVLRFW